MAAPAFLAAPEAAGKSDQLTGALVVTVSLVACGDVGRSCRFLNLGLGAWLLVAPLIFGSPWTALANDVVLGFLVVALSFRKGSVRERYGILDRYVV